MTRLPVLVAALVLLAGPASAVAFLEDFESYSLVGINPQTTPDQDWYNYREVDEIGQVSTDGPPLSDGQWMLFQSSSDDPSSQRANFEIAAPTQLTNISFQIAGVPITDNADGSRQFVSIQSSAPIRTMVTFYVFCDDETNPDGCELRVKWLNADTFGQVLINTTLDTAVFNITVLPHWGLAEFDLFVNGVDDGRFPFLDLPADVGRVRMGQVSGFFPLNMTFDNLAIDGALAEAVDISDDVAQGFKDFATEIKFTTSGSLFVFGLIVFLTLTIGVGWAMIAMSEDNTVAPALSFFATLVALWLIHMEWWPEWIGLTLIIVTAVLVALVVRERVMGMKDASNGAGIVSGALGYFIIASALLGFSGYAAEDVAIPVGAISIDQDTNETAEKQSTVGAVLECSASIVTFGFGKGDYDCSRDTVSNTWAKIVDVASTLFNYARTAFNFLFALLGFQLPIPTVFNVIIVIPPAVALAVVGYGLIRGTSA